MERVSSRPKVRFSDHSYSRLIIGVGAKAPLAPQFRHSRCLMYISTHLPLEVFDVYIHSLTTLGV